MAASSPQRIDCLYGINPCFEVIRAGRRVVYNVMLCKSSARNPRIVKLAEFLDSRAIPYCWQEKGRLIAACNSRDHQGVVAECGPFPYVPFEDQLGSSRLVLLDGIEDPHNAGAVMRSAEALGFEGVLLPRRGSVLVLPSVVKAASGACEFLKISCNCSANQYVKIAAEEGYAVVALDGTGDVDIETLRGDAPERVVLVVGGESTGVKQFILNTAQSVVRIPQFGKVNSLNASVAAGIAMQALSGPPVGVVG